MSVETTNKYPLGTRYWWKNEESEQVLNRGYLLKGETVEGAVNRVVNSAASRLHRPELAPVFKEIVEKGWMSLSSPIWANMGTERGLPISCNGVYIPDSIVGFVGKHGEVVMQTKHGSGTSGYFGDMRERGATITDNGESSGAVSFMEMFDTAMSVVSQGSCFKEGTRILTDKGFKDFRDVNPSEDKVYQVDAFNNGSFTSDYELVDREFTGNMYHFESRPGALKYSVNVTENHLMVYNNRNSETNEWSKETEKVRADQFELSENVRIPRTTLTSTTNEIQTIDDIESLDLSRCSVEQLSSIIDTYTLGVDTDSDEPFGYIRNQPKAVLDKLFAILTMIGATPVYSEGMSIIVYSMSQPHIHGEYLDRTIIPVVNERVYCAIVPEGRIVVEYEGCVTVISNTRRGSFAAYLDIDHGDVQEFLNIKDIGSPIQNLFTGLCIPDYWLKEMEAGDMEKRAIWAKVLESRQKKGLPYLFFSDNVNRYKPKWYIDKGMKIHASNLCSEIALPSSVDESFVCCLSSMNLELYDEWKDTDAVKIAIYFLDAVMEEYIEKTLGIPYMEASHNFAKNHRALGLGVLGWHSFLQRKRIPFDGLQAEMYNEVIFKHIRKQADEATRELAAYYGESPVTEGYGVRNSTVLSIAPTTSSSAILGQVSPGIEPFSSNYYKAGLAKGNFMRKNKYLTSLLNDRGLNTEETWRQIMLGGGSVRNVQGLTQEEKDIFKTFEEVNQMSIVNQAAARQKYIDQAQSVNLHIPPTVPVKEVNQLYLTAWKKGVKTLYYQRSKSVAKDLVTNLVTCTSCEA